MTPARVGLIGLGNMGTAIGERLLLAGYPLVVFNRTREKARPLEEAGALVSDSIGELVQAVDVVLTSVADDDALACVVEEIAPAARPGTLLIELSTVTAAVSARVATRVEPEVRYVRSPVSGNPSVVRSGNLSFIASGEKAHVDVATPLMLAIGSRIHYVGQGELARVVKLAINLILAGLGELMAEALVLGETNGVSRRALLEVMGDSAVGAPFVKYKSQPLIDDDYSPTFATKLMHKDVRLVLDLAMEAGVRLPVAEELLTRLEATMDAGYGDADFIALFASLRESIRCNAG